MSDDTENQRNRAESGKNSDNDDSSNEEKGGVKGLWQKVVVSGFDKEKNIGFFHKDLKEERAKGFKKYALTTLALCLLVFALLSLYWGALQHVNKNLHHITIFVVDMDGQVPPYSSNGIKPIVGPMVVQQMTEFNAQNTPHLGYVFRDAADFNNDPKAVWANVYHEHAWAAIIVNPNATTLLTQALQNGNASYDPAGALQMVYINARDETSYGEYILPELNTVSAMLVSKFGVMWAKQSLPLLSNSTALARAKLAPQALNPAIGFSQYNLRPFAPPVATPTVTVGLIYLIIISFFAFAFFMPIHSIFIEPEGHKPMHFGQWIMMRLAVTITVYFFLSFFYSLVSLSFRIPFSQSALPADETGAASRYGRASFFVYWMLNWCGTMALGLASENAGTLLGSPWFSIWLIFWVISNVCTAFYEITLAPGFFRYGFAWPLHNIVAATRTIVFDTHSRIGLNFGVLFAWIAVNVTLFPIICFFLRYGKLKEAKEEEKKKQEDDKDE